MWLRMNLLVLDLAITRNVLVSVMGLMMTFYVLVNR